MGHNYRRHSSSGGDQKGQVTTPIPFTVIGGFLGAGKTTLLNQILRNSQGVRYAVLVNDFGAINIDQSLIARHAGQTLSLANGCICCSLANGFVKTMLKLMQHPELIDHIVVEASGVSNPQRIMDFARLDPALQEDAIVVLADALNLGDQLNDHFINETITQQIASADILLLNKTDLISQSQLEISENRLHEINSDAPILQTQNAALPLELVLGRTIHRDITTAQSQQQHHAHDLFQSLAFHSDKIIDEAAFERFADTLPGSILRGKAILKLTTGAFYWHRVGTRNQLTKAASPNLVSEMVLIGYADDAELENLRQTALDELFESEVCSQP